MLRSKYLRTFVCRQCQSKHTKRLYSTPQKPHQPNPPNSTPKPKPPPLFSPQSQKSSSQPVSKPPPLFSSSSSNPKTTPLPSLNSTSNAAPKAPPLFNDVIKSAPSQSSTPQTNTPYTPYTPPILTPKPRPQNPEHEEESKVNSREKLEHERQEKYRLAQVKARDELFSKQQLSSEAEKHREMRKKAYDELVKSSYGSSSPPPRVSPPISPKLSKEELEAKQKEVMDDLDKLTNDYEGVLAAAQAKAVAQTKPTPPSPSPPRSPPPTSPSSSTASSPVTPSVQSPPTPPSPGYIHSTPTPNTGFNKQHKHTHTHTKKPNPSIPGETAKFKRPPKAEPLLYTPKPINEKEKVQRQGELPVGLETRASKVQQFLQYTQGKIAQGQLPAKKKMRGLLQPSVPAKGDVFTNRLQGFIEHEEKKKEEKRQNNAEYKAKIKKMQK